MCVKLPYSFRQDLLGEVSQFHHLYQSPCGTLQLPQPHPHLPDIFALFPLWTPDKERLPYQEVSILTIVLLNWSYLHHSGYHCTPHVLIGPHILSYAPKTHMTQPTCVHPTPLYLILHPQKLFSTIMPVQVSDLDILAFFFFLHSIKYCRGVSDNHSSLL